MKFDKGIKKDEYERSGVAEYWIVDPVTKIVEGFYLLDDVFVALPVAEGVMDFKLPDFSLKFK